VVRGNEGSLAISDFRGMDDEQKEGHGQNGGERHNPGGLADQIRVLITSVNKLRRENLDLKNEMVIFWNTTYNMIKNMNESVERIGRVPVLRAAHARNNHHHQTCQATRRAETMEVDVNVTNDDVIMQEMVVCFICCNFLYRSNLH
jgi:hypothetical protein